MYCNLKLIAICAGTYCYYFGFMLFFLWIIVYYGPVKRIIRDLVKDRSNINKSGTILRNVLLQAKC